MNNELFPILILAGGLATRLRPLTEKIPKSLIEINGVPFIERQLELLKSRGFKKAVICLGYLGEQVVDYVEANKNFGLDVSYSFDGDILLGTAGAVKKALPLLPENFFVTYGDSYLPTQYFPIQEHFLKSNKSALMTVFKNNNQWDPSNIEFNSGEILVYDKKNKTSAMQYIDYGLSIYHRSCFDAVATTHPTDLADLLQTLIAQKQLAGFEVHERFYEVGSFTGIEELNTIISPLEFQST